MAKAISLNLFAFLASVICAVSAYSEPNYPPPGPEWLHDIRAISYVWMYPGMFGKTPEEYAADANAIASNGYNTVVLFGCQDRLSYINKWPEIIAELNEIVPAFHQYGVRVFEHQSLGIVNEDCLDMPIPDSNYTIRDLAQIDANTLQPSYFPDWHVYRICNNNPLTQILINSHIRDIFTQTDIDGLMDDDVSFSKYTCVCQYCRDKAIRECGFDINDYIPPSSSPGQSFWFNPDDPNYRNWSRFHQNCVGEHYAQMRTLLDGIKPGLGLMGCMAQIVETEHAQIGGADLETLGWGVNLFMHEEISDAYFVEWLPGAVQLVRGLSIGRPSGRPNLNLQYAEYGAAELLFAWALDKTFACRAWCGDENPYRIGREISWEAGHPQLLNKPVVPANVAILYSVQSRDSLRPFMLERPTEEGPSPDFYGWCEALFYGNIPFHAITEDELTPQKLAPYRILILPSVTCLSISQCQTISEWTAAGGTLIATEDCAMYNETGELLNQSGLSDALGVDINEPELHCQTPVQVPDEGIFRGCGGQIDEPVRTRFACAPHNDAHALGLIEEGATTPAMVSHNFGNGNSVYFAFRLGSAAWTRRMSCFICCDPNNPDPNCSDPDNQYITLGPTTPTSYQVILNLMTPVKPLLAFTVDHDAPAGLIVTLNKLADGKQVLHMLNTTGATFVMDGKLHVVEKHYTQFPLITQDTKVTLREPPALPVTAHLPGGFDILLDVDTKTNTITVPGYVISPYTIIETGAWPSADLNRDGIVDFRDFAILADQWLQKEP